MKKSSLISSHGKLLLKEFEGDSCDVRLDFVLDCLQKDKLSPRLKDENGNCVYHKILASGRASFFLQILIQLVKICPEGLRIANKEKNLPIHMYLTQQVVESSIVKLLIEGLYSLNIIINCIVY